MALSGSVFEIWHVTDRQTDRQTSAPFHDMATRSGPHNNSRIVNCQVQHIFLNSIIMKEQDDTLWSYIKRVMTDLRQHFFSDRIVNKWNTLGEDIVSTSSLNIFKGKLQRLHNAYLVLTLCGLALRSTRMTRPRVQRTSPWRNPSLWI